jgi:hypothetical protein
MGPDVDWSLKASYYERVVNAKMNMAFLGAYYHDIYRVDTF